MGCLRRGCRRVRAKTSGSNVPRCSTKRSRAVRNPARISANSWALWLASWVLRLPRSATASVSRSVRKSSTRAIHRGSRSSKWPACSWTDHFSCGLPTSTSTSVVTLRSISSRRAGVPHRRTQMLGYCSPGNVKSNFRPNHAGTLLDSGRGKLCSHHGPTWNSEALRLITTLFLLRVHFTVRIHFPIQMSPQPSRSQRSNQTESATRQRRRAHGLLALRLTLRSESRTRCQPSRESP
jgi:hypothetical protein